jgi:hypothetical protein
MAVHGCRTAYQQERAAVVAQPSSRSRRRAAVAAQPSPSYPSPRGRIVAS